MEKPPLVRGGEKVSCLIGLEEADVLECGGVVCHRLLESLLDIAPQIAFPFHWLGVSSIVCHASKQGSQCCYLYVIGVAFDNG